MLLIYIGQLTLIHVMISFHPDIIYISSYLHIIVSKMSNLNLLVLHHMLIYDFTKNIETQNDAMHVNLSKVNSLEGVKSSTIR